MKDLKKKNFSEILKRQDQSLVNKEKSSEINDNIMNNENIDTQNKLNNVFFDEFNTSNSQVLLTEIICKQKN
jgi:hypothetical protein